MKCILVIMAALTLDLNVQAQFTFTGMNGIRMDMTKTAIEQLIQKKIPFKDDWTDIPVEINGVTVNIIFHIYTDTGQYMPDDKHFAQPKKLRKVSVAA